MIEANEDGKNGKKYVSPAFDEKRQDELVKNWGYSDIKYHRFDLQSEVYNQLEKIDKRLNDEIKKFISFLAGVGFFEKYNLTLTEWFDMKNWDNPNVENKEGYSINEIISYSYGINYFKDLLTQMPYWNR